MCVWHWQLAILTDDGEQLNEPGAIGEVCIRGENVAASYHNRPDANETEYRFGWFHTGDQGHLDEDGYLYLVGRIKELINRGGEKISPLEVDAVLLGVIASPVLCHNGNRSFELDRRDGLCRLPGRQPSCVICRSIRKLR
eukprot:SAG31_NODE_1609_length_7753_cov_12.390253_2_plen_140_part_00